MRVAGRETMLRSLGAGELQKLQLRAWVDCFAMRRR